MSRASNAQRAMRLNHARELLQRFDHLPDAVAQMRKDSGLSRRQAYRYLQQAAHLKQPLLVGDTRSLLRETFASLGSAPSRFREPHRFVVSEIVSRALLAALPQRKKTWLNGLHSTATRFNSNIASIGCSLKKSSKPTNFSCLPYVDRLDLVEIYKREQLMGGRVTTRYVRRRKVERIRSNRST